jgi:hypothetical protein
MYPWYVPFEPKWRAFPLCFRWASRRPLVQLRAELARPAAEIQPVGSEPAGGLHLAIAATLVLHACIATRSSSFGDQVRASAKPGNRVPLARES